MSSTYLAPDCAVLQKQAEAVWEKLNGFSCAPATEIPTPQVTSFTTTARTALDFEKFIVPTQQGEKKPAVGARRLEPITIEDLATPAILIKKVNCILGSGGAQNIVKTFKGFKLQKPENFLIDLILGHAYMKLCQYSLAREHYLQVQSTRPEHPNILNLLARVEVTVENYSGAISLYELCLLYTSPSPRDRG